MKSFLLGPLKTFLVPIILIGIWFVSSSETSVFFPRPDVVWTALVSDVNADNTLFLDFVISTKRILMGSAIGISIGLTLGAIIAANSVVKSFFDSTISSLKCLPTTALVPFVIMVFGMTEFAAVTVIAVSAAIPSLISAINEVGMVKEKYQVLAQNLELSYSSRMTKLYFPGALPGLYTGIDLSFNLAFRMLVLAEVLGSSSGLAFRLMESAHYLKFDRVLYVLIILGIMSVCVTNMLNLIRRRNLKWM